VACRPRGTCTSCSQEACEMTLRKRLGRSISYCDLRRKRNELIVVLHEAL
jgi:hypothetical protein